MNGACGACVSGTQYNTQLGACVCPPGSYVNPQGICEPRIVPLPSCNNGQYLGAGNQCFNCLAGCARCTSATTCTQCSDPGAVFFNGACQTRRCGNGIIEGIEACDDNNNVGGDGCSNTCQIEANYQCFGSPSVCRPILVNLCGNGLPDANEQCDDRNTFSNDGCSSACLIENGWRCSPAIIGRPSVCVRQTNPSNGMTAATPIVNSNNVYVTIKTEKEYIFANAQEMSGFIQYQIPVGFTPASAYCRQRASNLFLFDCLFNYPTGVPRSTFTINFSYSRNGDSGYTQATVSPTNSLFNSRSLR